MNTAQKTQLQNTLRRLAQNADAIADLLEPRPNVARDDAAIAKLHTLMTDDWTELGCSEPFKSLATARRQRAADSPLARAK